MISEISACGQLWSTRVVKEGKKDKHLDTEKLGSGDLESLRRTHSTMEAQPLAYIKINRRAGFMVNWIRKTNLANLNRAVITKEQFWVINIQGGSYSGHLSHPSEPDFGLSTITDSVRRTVAMVMHAVWATDSVCRTVAMVMPRSVSHR